VSADTCEMKTFTHSDPKAAPERGSCSGSEQASHNGDLVHAVQAGAIGRAEVTELGAVLAGTAAGRRGGDDVTVFDSTGLAIQDLAIALAALERADELDLPQVPL
jgi:alanine dehydrogenase